VGVAVSDEGGAFALPHATLDADDAITSIVTLVADVEPEAIVVGWPLEMSGREGPAVAKVKAFLEEMVAALEEAEVSLEVVRWDERLTTMAAESMLIERDMSRRKRKQVVDQVAATRILQGYLDSLQDRPVSDDEGQHQQD